MKSGLHLISIAVALTLVLCAGAMGANDDFGYGARGVAMGQAQAAASNDYFSLFYNPATLGQAREYWGLGKFQPFVQMGEQGSRHSLYLNGVNQQEEYSPSIVFGLIVPITKRLTFGGGVFFSTDNIFVYKLFYGPTMDRWVGDQTSSMIHGFSYMITKKLWVGYTTRSHLAYNGSELQFDMTNILNKLLGLNLSAETTNINSAFEMDIISHNSYALGALYKPFKWIGFGLNYNYRNPSPLQMPVHIVGGGIIPDIDLVVDQPGLNPTILTGGVAVWPGQHLTLAFDLSYAFYSLEHQPGLRVKTDSPLITNATEFKTLRPDNVYIPKIGVEWKDNFRGRFERAEYAIRVGYQYYPSPYPPVLTKNNMSNIIDNDAYYYTGGFMIGYHPNRGGFMKGPAYAGIEYFYEYIHLADRTSRSIARNPPVIVSEGHVIFNGISLTTHW